MGPLGFGGGAIGNLYGAITDADASAAMHAALAGGIRYYDTAPHYGFGLSERRLGDFWRESGGAPDAVLSSKVGRVLVPAPRADLGALRQGFVSPEPFDSEFDYSYDGVLRSFESSVARLGRRIDILFAHDLGRRTHGERHEAHLRAFLEGGLRAMRELREAGTIDAIGLGVNEWQICEQVLEQTDLDVVLLAGRYTLLDQSSLDSFLPLCERRGVAVIAAAPFNSGVLARGEEARGPAHYDYGAAPSSVLARAAEIQEVCERHGVALAAAALQFPLGHPAIVGVLPGLASAAQVRDTQRWWDCAIPGALWQELRERRLIRADAPTPGGSPA